MIHIPSKSDWQWLLHSQYRDEYYVNTLVILTCIIVLWFCGDVLLGMIPRRKNNRKKLQ